MKDAWSPRLRRLLVAGVVAVFASTALVSVVQAARTGNGSPAATGQYEKKVTICHRTGSKKNPFVTIRVSRNAVPAHLRHGDTIGPCNTQRFTICHKNQKPKAQRTKKAKSQRTMRVRFRSLRAHMRHGDRVGRCKPKGRPGNAGRKKGPKPKQPNRPRPPRGR